MRDIWKLTLVALAALYFPLAAAADDLLFDIAPTTACLATKEGELAKLTCAGLATTQCIEKSAFGYTTIGMSGCADREREWWDVQLNATYQALRAETLDFDAEMAELGGFAPPMAPALLEMQRAWITYRDARCGFEMSKWGGGTGGGPAIVSCLLHETARQTLLLEAGTGFQ
ncbi:MAG: lysozyme inhibitor LprI family protein [Pseudomonadota bacterium]